jgi:hypothetical protein
MHACCNSSSVSTLHAKVGRWEGINTQNKVITCSTQLWHHVLTALQVAQQLPNRAHTPSMWIQNQHQHSRGQPTAKTRPCGEAKPFSSGLCSCALSSYSCNHQLLQQHSNHSAVPYRSIPSIPLHLTAYPQRPCGHSDDSTRCQTCIAPACGHRTAQQNQTKSLTEPVDTVRS